MRPQGAATTLSHAVAVKPKNPPAKGRSILRTFFCSGAAKKSLDKIEIRRYHFYKLLKAKHIQSDEREKGCF